MPTDDGQYVWAIRSAPDLGRTVGDLRRLRGLTQQQLADLTGISRNYLALLESSSDTLELQRLLLALRRLGADITVTAGPPSDAT